MAKPYTNWEASRTRIILDDALHSTAPGWSLGGLPRWFPDGLHRWLPSWVIVIVIVIVVIVIVDSGLPGGFLYRALGKHQGHKGEKKERTKQHDA